MRSVYAAVSRCGGAVRAFNARSNLPEYQAREEAIDRLRIHVHPPPDPRHGKYREEPAKHHVRQEVSTENDTVERDEQKAGRQNRRGNPPVFRGRENQQGKSSGSGGCLT